jgi:hypothetical protein
LRVYWQGPSLGFDWGGDGARTMTLVYNLPATNAIYQRFAGIDGSAYIIGGFGMTALTANNIVLVPIRSGIGLRLGANIGYLKYTPRATWNPFQGSSPSGPGFTLTTGRAGLLPARHGMVLGKFFLAFGSIGPWSNRSCTWRSVSCSRCCAGSRSCRWCITGRCA